MFRPTLLLLAVGCLTATAEDKPMKDEKTKADKPAAKKADWSGFSTAGEISGVVVTADDGKVTVQLTKVYPVLGWSGNGRVAGVRRVYTEPVDFDFKFADAGLVRWKKLPPKPEVDGKKGAYTSAEMEKLRLPVGVPGYAAERTDLQSGHVVEVTLVKPKGVATVAPEDLSIKTIVIHGKTAAPTPSPRTGIDR